MSDVAHSDDVAQAARREGMTAYDRLRDGVNDVTTGGLVDGVVDAAITFVVRDLRAMLFPEEYPGYDHSHVYWQSHEPQDDVREPFLWSAETIEWVAQWCDERLKEVQRAR